RNHRMEIEVHEVRVNEPMDKNVFTLEAMDIDPSTVTNMTEYSAGGLAKQVKAYWRGQWVSVSSIPGRATDPDEFTCEIPNEPISAYYTNNNNTGGGGQC